MKLGCMAGVEYKDKIIFSSTYINGLFEMDMHTRKVRFIQVIDGEVWEAHLFRKAFLFGNEAWFIPQRGNHVICINLDTYYIEYFELKYEKKFEEHKEYPYYYAYIDGLVVNERYLYCIPNGLDSLLVIDMQNHNISSIKEINNPEKDLIYGAFFYQEKVNLLSQKGKLNKRIYIESKKVEKGNWQFDSNNFLSSIQNGTDLYLIPAYMKSRQSRKMAKIDLYSGEVTYIKLPDISEEYYGGIFIKDSLILLPDYGVNFIKMDNERKIFEKVKYPLELKNRLKCHNNTARAIASMGRKLISFIHSGYILEFNENGNIINYFETGELGDVEVQKLIKNYREKKIVFPKILVQEKEMVSLSEYIQLI